MAEITSTKFGSQTGREAKHFNGSLSPEWPVTFSGGELCLNLFDGDRVWHVILDVEEAGIVGRRVIAHWNADGCHPAPHWSAP